MIRLKQRKAKSNSIIQYKQIQIDAKLKSAKNQKKKGVVPKNYAFFRGRG